MENTFWLEKWNKNEIGFHQEDYNPTLVKFWDDFTEKKPGKVFVPLCGKSLDMKFFVEKGHHVVGSELSKLAVEAFFNENNLEYSNQDDIYSSHEKYKIFCGDIFNIDPKLLNDIDFIYDRAALVALPIDMRKKYANWIKKIGHKQTKIFLIAFDFRNDEVGPPFSVPESWVRENFSDSFNINVYNVVEVPKEKVEIHQDKVDSFAIKTYFLEKK